MCYENYYKNLKEIWIISFQSLLDMLMACSMAKVKIAFFSSSNEYTLEDIFGISWGIEHGK